MIARQSVLTVSNSVVGAGLGFAALFAMVRYMGPEIVGARQFALSAIFLVGIVTRLGFPVTHARRLARGEDPAASTGSYLVLKLGLTGLFAVLASVAAYVWFHLLDRDVQDTTTTALFLAALVVLSQSVRDVAVNTFRGMRRILEREAVLFTNTIVTASTAIWVAVAYARSHGRWVPFPEVADWLTGVLGQTTPMGFERALALLMGGYLLGDVAALALAIALFVRSGMPVGRPRRAVLRDYWSATLPLMVLSVSAVAATRINHLLVGFWWDSRELGLYAVALRLNDVLMLIPNGVTIALLPAVAHLDRGGERDKLRTLMLQTERWVSMLLWPGVVLVALNPKAVLHILGSDQVLDAAPILVILAFQALVASLRIPLQTKALGLGHHGTAARVATVALAVNLGLAVLLVPQSIAGIPLAGLGARGAALAALGAAVVTLFAYRVRAKEWTDHPYLSPHLVRHAAAGAATYALAWLALRPLGLLSYQVRFWELAFAGLLVGAMYLAILWAMRELTWREVRELAKARRQATAPAESLEASP